MCSFFYQPKYMESLLKAAAARKRDFERTVERQVQKEREQEEGDYDDKEAFVTDAYPCSYIVSLELPMGAGKGLSIGKDFKTQCETRLEFLDGSGSTRSLLWVGCGCILCIFHLYNSYFLWSLVITVLLGALINFQNSQLFTEFISRLCFIRNAGPRKSFLD